MTSPQGSDFPNRRIHQLVESRPFNHAALAAIVISSICIGVETYLPGSPTLFWLGKFFAVVFLVELILRFMGRTTTRAYFSDGWNLFDIVVVAAAFIPASAFPEGTDGGALVPLLRILRVLRVMRLVRSVRELRVIVEVLGRSIISMKWIGLLALLCFYIFGIIGVKLFRDQPEFATLHEALFTLFRCLTGDDWTQLRYEALDKGVKNAAFITTFYVVWILLGTFILINLVVGAIINNYQEVQEVEHARTIDPNDLDAQIAAKMTELQQLMSRRQALTKR